MCGTSAVPRCARGYFDGAQIVIPCGCVLQAAADALGVLSHLRQCGPLGVHDVSGGGAIEQKGNVEHLGQRSVRTWQRPADDELPQLDVGPFIWRSADVGVTAAVFMAYSTGVAFTLVALSKGHSLRGDDTLDEDSLASFRLDLGAGSLKFGAQGVP